MSLPSKWKVDLMPLALERNCCDWIMSRHQHLSIFSKWVLTCANVRCVLPGSPGWEQCLSFSEFIAGWCCLGLQEHQGSRQEPLVLSTKVCNLLMEAFEANNGKNHCYQAMADFLGPEWTKSRVLRACRHLNLEKFAFTDNQVLNANNWILL